MTSSVKWMASWHRHKNGKAKNLYPDLLLRITPQGVKNVLNRAECHFLSSVVPTKSAGQCEVLRQQSGGS
jgi:hypothetical protein